MLFSIILVYTPENKVKGTDISGEFSGYLTTAGSPYIITDNLTVPFHGFLDIRPGVELRFNKGAILYIMGAFWANGTSSKPIRFTSNLGTPYIGCWQGIKLYLTGRTQFLYCDISYAIWGINVQTSYLITMKYCNIYKCGNATEFSGVSNTTFVNNNIHDNLFHGMNATNYCYVMEIYNNTFARNTKGIRLSHVRFAIIKNNTIISNQLKGIELRYSMYVEIYDNTIDKTGPPIYEPGRFIYNDIALHLNRSYINIIKRNKILDTKGFALLLNRSSSNRFENNIIDQNTQTGIHLSAYCGYNVFQNNTIKNVPKTLIVLNQNSIENYFKNNIMTKTNAQYAVLYGENSIHNSFAPDNKINSIFLPIYYRAPSDFLNNTYKSLTVSEPKLTNLGQIVFVECENFVINGCKISNGASAFYFYDTHNVSIIKSTSLENSYGFYFGYNSTNITIDNSTITNAVTKDLYLDEYANVTIINSTFNKQRIINKSPSNLKIQWYLHVKVIYGLGTEPKLIKNANIKVGDKYKNLVYNGTTNSDGTVRFIKCTESEISDKGVKSYNEHNITAIKMHYQPGYAGLGVTIDKTKWVQIRLTDNHDPILTGLITPYITHNPRPQIFWPIGVDPDFDTLTYWFKIWNTKNPNIVLEQKRTVKTNYLLQKNLTYGERYEISINASDPYGGWSNNITGKIDVINNLPSKPQILIIPIQTKSEPSRNKDLNCTIIVPSEDVDRNPKDKIKYNFLWYKNGVLQKQLSIWNSTKDYHVLPHEFTSTGELWLCEVSATDGIDITASVSDSRIIRNTPPRVKQQPKPIVMDEDTIDFDTIYLDKIFTDDDGDDLIYSFSITGNNISLAIQRDNSVLIIPNHDWSGYELARFSASDGEGVIHTVIKITVLQINDPPYSEIITPIHNTPYFYNETQGIKFEGMFKDPDLMFGDALNLTWQSNISGVFGHSAILNNVILDIGIHKIDFIVRDKSGEIAKDTIIIKIYDILNPPPDITSIELDAPFLEQILDYTDVTFYWHPLGLTELEAESVLYDIYLYKDGEPKQKLIEKYVGTNITIFGLEDNSTYHWTVVPFRNNTQGICLSGIWSFDINLGVIYKYSYELSFEVSNIVITVGKIREFNLTIWNTGNVPNKFNINILLINNTNINEFVKLDKQTATIKNGQRSTIKISFNIPKDYTEVNITDILRIVVTPQLGKNKTELNINTSIIGYKKPITPKPPKITEDEVDNDLMNLFLLLLIIIVIIFILVLMFMVFLNNSMKRELRSNFPIKSKQVVSKERKISK